MIPSTIHPEIFFLDPAYIETAKSIDSNTIVDLECALVRIGDVNRISELGATLLIYALMKKNYRAMVLLTDRGADVNISGRDNMTPLKIATMMGWTDGMRFLLNMKASPNTTDEDGDTPLHYATMQSILEAEKDDANEEDTSSLGLLLQYGAAVNAANDLGITPLMLACEMGGMNCARILMQAGADPDIKDMSGLTAKKLAHPWDFPEEILTKNH